MNEVDPTQEFDFPSSRFLCYKPEKSSAGRGKLFKLVDILFTLFINTYLVMFIGRKSNGNPTGNWPRHFDSMLLS